MSKAKRLFRIFERRVDHGWEITKADPTPMIAAHIIVLLLALLLSGCGSDSISNEDFIAESARCEENGFASRTVKSGWDGTITGVQCYTPRKFQPHQTEFQLTDGTRCVMVSTPMATSRRAGSSGISCDWDSTTTE